MHNIESTDDVWHMPKRQVEASNKHCFCAMYSIRDFSQNSPESRKWNRQARGSVVSEDGGCPLWESRKQGGRDPDDSKMRVRLL